MLIRRHTPAHGNRPAGPFSLNVDSPQAQGLVAWLPLTAWSGTRNMAIGTSTPAPVNAPAAVGVPLHGSGHQFVRASDRYLNLGDPTALQFSGAAATFSLSIWYYLASVPPGDDILIAKDADTGGRSYTLDVDADAGARMYVNGGTNSNFIAPEGRAAQAGDLRHVCGTVDQNSLGVALYIDGVLDQFQGQPTTVDTATAPVLIGRRSYSGFEGPFDGVLWDARIYNRALSDEAVWQLYDPQTRWDLYRVPSTRVFFDVGSGATPRRFFLV